MTRRCAIAICEHRLMINTGIGEDDGVIRRRIPVMTQAYNRYMRGVDGLDQLASYNPYLHRSRKWYIKLFDYILEITLINARILLEKHKRTRISGTAFRQALIDQLLARHLERKDVVPGPAGAPQRAGDAPEPEPEPQHWFERHPDKKRKTCAVCNPRTRTYYFCNSCPGQPSLCLDPCFRLYHMIGQNAVHQRPDRPAKQHRAAPPADAGIAEP